MSNSESIFAYRYLIESALAYSGNTHSFEDVVAEVVAGTAQFWPAPNSCIVTQIDTQPARKILVFWLAAGNSVELKAMEPMVVEWGQEEGCTLARMAGRKGWARSFLMDTGWQDTGYVILQKEL
jgi:hypothetical protein